MKTKLGMFLSLLSLFIIALSLYDFYSTRRAQLASGPTLTPTLTLDAPAPARSSQAVEFSWRLDSATPRSTSFTTIFWDDQSSPSALPTTAHPLAVGYRHHLTDFENGQFSLPAQFSGSIQFDSPGNYYYRAYALIEGSHLWTPEYTITIR